MCQLILLTASRIPNVRNIAPGQRSIQVLVFLFSFKVEAIRDLGSIRGVWSNNPNKTISVPCRA